MGTTWTKTAYWLTILDGVPRYHDRNYEAMEFGKKHKVPVFRQDAWNRRIVVVYEPITDTTYTVSKALYVGDA